MPKSGQKNQAKKAVFRRPTSALIIRANIKGKAKQVRFKGDIYFTAIPKVDDENKVVSITDFKIEPNTNSFLINKGLPFLVDNFYYEKIKEELNYSYLADHDKYKSLINNELKNIKLDKLLISGELQEIKSPGFYLDSEAIEVILIAHGIIKSSIDISSE